MKDWIRRHPLSSFFSAAYALSWLIAVPLALQAQGVLGEHLPWTFHYLTAFGPAAAAMLVAHVTRNPAAKDGSPTKLGTHSILWWTVGFGSPLLLFVIALVMARIVDQATPTWTSLGRINFLPDLGLGAWGLWFVTSGCGEELGWRGFALPRLQRRHSALTSSVLLAIGWAGWHLPAFFYVPSYTGIGLRILPGFFLGVLAGAIVLTWLYNSSGGSVLAAVLWHASFNFVTASPNAGGFVVAATSTFVIVWAVAVVWHYDWSTLATRGRRWSVSARSDERTRALPGDDFIPAPIASVEHAITIGRPRRDVWPWLAQMGAGKRAGWYSYDFLDNGRRVSAWHIVPELQQLTLGMIFPALPGSTDGFTLLAFEPERSLILGLVTPGGIRLMTWAFILDEPERGSTRLVVRVRVAPGSRVFGLPWWAAKQFVTAIHFIMQRKQLLGIVRRAEHHVEKSSSDQRKDAA